MMATAGEGLHVMQGPDYGAIQKKIRLEGRFDHAGHPMKVQDAFLGYSQPVHINTFCRKRKKLPLHISLRVLAHFSFLFIFTMVQQPQFARRIEGQIILFRDRQFHTRGIKLPICDKKRRIYMLLQQCLVQSQGRHSRTASKGCAAQGDRRYANGRFLHDISQKLQGVGVVSL